MSIESAKAFLTRMKDEKFKAGFSQCQDDESRRAYLEAEGLLFSKKELDEVMSELSDEQLYCVSGGMGCGPIIPV